MTIGMLALLSAFTSDCPMPVAAMMPPKAMPPPVGQHDLPDRPQPHTSDLGHAADAALGAGEQREIRHDRRDDERDLGDTDEPQGVGDHVVHARQELADQGRNQDEDHRQQQHREQLREDAGDDVGLCRRRRANRHRQVRRGSAAGRAADAPAGRSVVVGGRLGDEDAALLEPRRATVRPPAPEGGTRQHAHHAKRDQQPVVRAEGDGDSDRPRVRRDNRVHGENGDRHRHRHHGDVATRLTRDGDRHRREEDDGGVEEDRAADEEPGESHRQNPASGARELKQLSAEDLASAGPSDDLADDAAQADQDEDVGGALVQGGQEHGEDTRLQGVAAWDVHQRDLEDQAEDDGDDRHRDERMDPHPDDEDE
ncbi:hypothetical protein QE406_000986 [Microbacterium testaceum]|nr:hypothetical protein [Microbacterium testaceum]MDQ1114977.1 hypothetical protein [Microbacterium testaceum]